MRDKQIYDWYIVVNKEGKAFTGLAYRGYLYSDNWGEAKPLKRENTPILLRQPGMSGLISKGMNVQRIDVDTDTEYSAKYAVRSVPTLLLVDGNGNILNRLTGNRSEQEILNFYNNG